MYQSNTTTYSESDFSELTKIFEETITKFELDELHVELDINKTFIPNHACIWNKIDNIDRHCNIMQKNSKLALVMFTDENEITSSSILEHLYRLEDLTYIQD